MDIPTMFWLLWRISKSLKLISIAVRIEFAAFLNPFLVFYSWKTFQNSVNQNLLTANYQDVKLKTP
jgi:hypothetical protein